MTTTDAAAVDDAGRRDALAGTSRSSRGWAARTARSRSWVTTKSNRH